MKNLKSTLTMGAILPAALFAQERPNIIYIMTDQQTASIGDQYSYQDQP